MKAVARESPEEQTYGYDTEDGAREASATGVKAFMPTDHGERAEFAGNHGVSSVHLA